MSLDVRIKEAISEAVYELRQDEGLSNKMIAWIEALVSGNESLEDRDSVYRHLELLYDATTVEIEEDTEHEDDS